jgi:N-acetylglucosaminyldiphosphoundecaprenol N-acetyl-beta-D-mannosaminyltransferase
LIAVNLNTLQMEKRSDLGSFITTGSYRDFVNKIFFLVENKLPAYVCFANVHMVVEAYRDRSFQKILNEAALVAPDGKPVSVFLRLAERLKQDRICGMDIFPDILERAETTGKSVYFYGTTPELLKTISEKAHKEFPALKIAGYHSPPFRNLSTGETADIIKVINKVKPDLVFVSLGCPKQEKWMAENKDKIGACFLGLGQAFKVYAGEEKRLPQWMRELSLEWAYRLWLEPRRLWRRYLFTNSFFILLTAKDLFRLWLKAIRTFLHIQHHQPAN